MLELSTMSIKDRLLSIILSPFGNDAHSLHLTEVTGEDYLSSPYYFSLTALTNNPSIDLKKLIGQPISFRLGSLTGEHTIYHALVYSAVKNGVSANGEPSITLLVQPWFRFLADKIDSRIFAVEKPLSIPEIVTSVFKINGNVDYKFELNKTYQPLNICVQHDESDFNFVSRLLNEAGIYYYFTHTENAHTMVLTDTHFPKMAKPVTAKYESDTHSDAHINNWRAVATPSVLSMNAQRFDFKNPQELVAAQHKSTLKTSGLPNAFLANVFQYDNLPTDATEEQLSNQLQQKMTAAATSSRYVTAQSHYPSWQAGTVFSLHEHDISQQTGDYYIYAIAHSANDRSSVPDNKHHEHAQHYQNEFRAYKTSQNFVPQARFQEHKDIQDPFSIQAPSSSQLVITKPQISGLHTATVVGPKDTPIYTDKYGRIKVQFDWDTHSKSNENSFAWVRMKQSWGSNQFGAHFTPRVGQEVLVSFDHGDPNKPIIVGVMPSDSSMPPFAPNKTPTQLGFRTQSLAKDAMQHTIPGHQIMFDDDSTQPKVHLHSYKDLQQTTTNDYTLNVQGKSTTTVEKGDYIQTVGGKIIINAKNAVHIVNGESRISITPSDITIEASKISLGSGIGSSAHVSNATKLANHSLMDRIGNAEYDGYNGRIQANKAAGKLIVDHPIDAATIVAGTSVDETGIGEVLQKDAVEDVAGNVAKDKLPLPKNPDELVSKHGYEELSHPDALENGHRLFKDPKTGDKLRHDMGNPEKNGFEKIDHYHHYNPNSTNKMTRYLDKNGMPVAQGSTSSHLLPEEKS